MGFKLFGKKSKSSQTSTEESSLNPPDYDHDSTERYDPHPSCKSQLIFRVANLNQDLEQVEPDKKRGTLPAYETEKDHHLRKLMDNYGSGGSMGGFGGSPKIPTMPPRVKKPKKEKPPKYPA
jgi:hypothetical protein